MPYKKAEIDLDKDAVYQVRDGQLIQVDTPGDGYGKQIITWVGGKPTHYEISYTKK